METIKEVRQDIKNKLEAINQDDYMVENDLKLVFAPSCGKYRIELTGSVNKAFLHIISVNTSYVYTIFIH